IGSTVTLVVTVNPLPTTSAITGPAIVCENDAGLGYSVINTIGSSYAWTVPAGASITAGAGTNAITVTFGSTSGNVQVVETNSAGCIGSTVTLVVTVNPFPTTSAITGPVTVCEGSVGNIYSVTETGGSSYVWTVPAGASITTNTGDSITVTFGSTSGNVEVVETDANGCVGSTVTLVVTVNPLPTTSAITGPVTVCEGSAGNIYSVTETAGSSYAWTVPAGASIITNIGDSITVTFSSASGDVTVIETSSAGCVGSAVTLAVTVNPIYNNTTPNNTICDGDSALIFGIYRFAAGAYYDSLTTVNGCDSITATTLVVNPVFSNTTSNDTICDSDSALIFGIYRTLAGTYYDSSSTINGCDSMTVTTLIVNPVYSTPVSTSICTGDSILLQGSYQTTAGTYYDTLTTVNGCDSVIVTTLVVNPAYSTPASESICSGDSIFLEGSYQTTASTYYDTLTAVNGCDSIITTTLTVNPTYSDTTFDIAICGGDSVLIFGIYRTIAGTYYDSSSTINGCDSMTATTLIVNPVYSTPVSTNICTGDSILLQGSYQTTAGAYYDTLTTVNGCDSITATTLLVNPVYSNTTPDDAICSGDSALIFGAYRFTAGTYYDSLTTVNGCDSITATTLVVNPGFSNITPNNTICDGDSALIFGFYRFAAGTYYDTLTAVNGCDSIITTTLTVNPTYSDTTSDITICDGDSALIFGIYRILAGTYYDSSSTINGCDSMVTTTLIVNPLPGVVSVTDITICYGSPTSGLVATGTNIQWYSDSLLTTLVFIGDTFLTGDSTIGVYTYYATQTIGGCEGAANTAVLTILSSPPAPIPTPSDTAVCTGAPVPDLTATGGDVKWYSDSNLINLVNSGNTFTTGQILPGTYIYYVTDSLPGCVSPAISITLTINSPPPGPVATDTTICYGEPTPDLVTTGTNPQWYGDPTLILLVNTGNTYTTGETSV
ncbi:hypothetical protein JYU16_02250, partial [bacterium AH-315-M05]|nr:hypothetical protein [bacterium AH-315-M05]